MSHRTPAPAPAATGANPAPFPGQAGVRESLFAEAFEHAGVGMALLRTDGRFDSVNRALRELLGHADLPGRAVSELVHPDDRDELMTALALLLSGHGESQVGEHAWVRADATTVQLRTTASVIRSGDDREARLVLSLEDVTEQRRVHDALAVSEIRFRALVENLPDTVIAIFDQDLRLAVIEGRGVASERYEGLLLSDLLGPERFVNAEPHYRAALAGESRQFDMGASDNATWWVHVVPLYDDSGVVVGGMAVWRDISERKRAERELEQHAHELERSNAELEQFAYIASHDLSEPLRMITSYLQLLERRYADKLDDDARDFIHYAVDGGARMRALIDDLLAYSRVGRAGRQYEPVDLAKIVGDLAGTLTAGREPAPVIKIGELPTINGDPGQLKQLFQNLLGNAIKFTRPGEAAEVEVSACDGDGDWKFTVADRGIGIDPAHSDRIFRVFQRLHARDDYPGTGVGLAIARKVVEGHGGKIWAEQREGGGTQFRLVIPEGRP